jgi:L-asparagine permease
MRRKSHTGGIIVTLAVYLVGVVLNYLVPAQVFEIVLNVASLGIVSAWSFIVVCQMMLRRAVNRREAAPVDFRMPFAPFTSWMTLAFLLSVLVLMGLDYPDALTRSRPSPWWQSFWASAG